MFIYMVFIVRCNELKKGCHNSRYMITNNKNFSWCMCTGLLIFGIDFQGCLFGSRRNRDTKPTPRMWQYRCASPACIHVIFIQPHCSQGHVYIGIVSLAKILPWWTVSVTDIIVTTLDNVDNVNMVTIKFSLCIDFFTWQRTLRCHRCSLLHECNSWSSMSTSTPNKLPSNCQGWIVLTQLWPWVLNRHNVGFELT